MNLFRPLRPSPFSLSLTILPQSASVCPKPMLVFQSRAWLILLSSAMVLRAEMSRGSMMANS